MKTFFRLELPRFVLAALVLGLLTGRASAVDEVVLQSTGETIRGTIANITKSGLEVQQTGRATPVAVTDIADIRWDSEPPELNITRIRERNGELEEALKSYQTLADSIEAAKVEMKKDVNFLVARTLGKQAIADPAKKDAAIKALEDFVNANAESIRYYEALDWLGRVQKATGELAAAKTTYQRIAGAEIPEIKTSGLNALGRVKIEEEDFAGATADFDQVIQAGGQGPAAMRQQFAAQLGKAIVLQKQGDNAGSTKLLDEVIAKSSPDDAAVQAEAFLQKGICHEALGQQQDALLAFLHVDILFSSQPDAHAEALFHLTRLWDAAGRADRAGAARAGLTQRYPNSEWAKQL